MKNTLSLRLFAAALPCLPLLISAQGEINETNAAAASEHVVVTPTELKWATAPPSVPPGAQVAVLEGDPAKKGPFTVRFKTPDGYKVPPHTHPTAEKITVLSGTMLLGTGAIFDEKVMRELPPGSFMIMPAGMQHFVLVRGDTTIQINGDGPFEIKYVNPADDPRQNKKQ